MSPQRIEGSYRSINSRQWPDWYSAYRRSMGPPSLMQAGEVGHAAVVNDWSSALE